MQDHLGDKLGHLWKAVLKGLWRVFLTVGGNQQALETSHDIEEIGVPRADITHVAGVKPAVDDGIGSRLGILPVAGHDVLATDDDFAFFADRHFLAVTVAYLYVHRLDYTAGRAEDCMAFGVGADNRSRLSEAVALEHRHTHGAEESLKFDVQQGAASNEEAHPAAESFADILENELVEEPHKRLSPPVQYSAAVVVFLVISNGIAYREVEEFLDGGAFGLDAVFDILLEVAGQRGHRKHNVRTGLLDGDGHVAKGSEGVLADGDECYRPAVIHHCVHTGYVGEAMVQRKDYQHNFAFSYGNYGVALSHVCGVVAMGQKDTLRVCSGPGSVAYISVIVRAYALVALHEVARAGFEKLVAHCLHLAHADFIRFEAVVFKGCVVEDNYPLQLGAGGFYSPDFRKVVSGNQHPFGF